MKVLKTVKLLSVSICLVTVGTAVALADEPDFTSLQVELLSTPGSLSNAWADYDNDGDLDLLVSISNGELRLYQNDHGTLVSVGKELGLPLKGDQIRGVSWGDYDGDGDVDIMGGSNVSPIPSRSYVYRNEGGEKFVEVAEEIGLTTPGRFSRQSNWIDYDNDGDLDLYAANRTGRNRLYRNDAGHFVTLGFVSGALDVRRTVGACWFDFDRDGDLDLFLANQAGDSDALLRNDQGKFVDVAPELGMDQTHRSQTEGGVGCAVGDYDNDGDFDLYVATYGDNLLYKNNGDGTFSEVAKPLGVTGPDHTVGVAWADYDNDGKLDLFASGSHRVNGVSEPLNLLYRNTGDGFESVIAEESMLNAGDHGVEWIDFDSDGDVDLSVTDGFGPTGGHFLFRNNLPAEVRARSLSVLVLDSKGHFTQAGAEVRLFNEKDETLASRLVSTGGGYNAQSASPVYFGLPSTAPVTVEVTFMSADGPLIQRVEGVEAQIGSGNPLKIYRDEKKQ